MIKQRLTYLLLLVPALAHLATSACAKDEGQRTPDSGAAGSAGMDGSAGSAGDAATGADATLDGGADAKPDSDACPPYDLKSYDGSTDGLCPAEENTGCFCFELTQGGGIECDPNGAGCVLIPSNCDRCGWLDCTSYTAACAAVYSEGDIQDAKASPWKVPCVSDEGCAPTVTGEYCKLRVGNRMFCAP